MTGRLAYRAPDDQAVDPRAPGESERQLRAIFDGALDAMLLVDDAGRCVDCNTAASALFGRDRAALLDARLGELLGPDGPPPRPLEGQVAGRWRLGRDGGDEREIDYAATARVLPDRHLWVLRDVTEREREVAARRRAEERLRAVEAELAHAHKLEAMGRLAGGVAHDFNNLLTVILGASESLLAQSARHDAMREELREIHAAARRAATLTRQLLAFGRKQQLQPVVLDLRPLVRGVERMLERLLGAHITLELALADEAAAPSLTMSVCCDPGQLELVLVNLAVNARDAMPDGGRLRIATRHVEERAPGEAAAPRRWVELSVRDTGVGMDAATRERIFEPFFTTKAPGHGTGLGLSTVYGIVTQSGGRITVESEPGQGTCFRILLPTCAPETGPRTEAPAHPATRGRETVLLVEDENLVRRFVRRALDRLGYTVLEADDPADALRIVDTHAGAIDLLLTDVVMPGLSGRELARRLLVRLPSLRVLYMSGYSEGTIAHRGLLDDGCQLLEKPLTLESLGRRVRDVLDRAR